MTTALSVPVLKGLVVRHWTGLTAEDQEIVDALLKEAREPGFLSGPAKPLKVAAERPAHELSDGSSGVCVAGCPACLAEARPKAKALAVFSLRANPKPKEARALRQVARAAKRYLAAKAKPEPPKKSHHKAVAYPCACKGCTAPTLWRLVCKGHLASLPKELQAVLKRRKDGVSGRVSKEWTIAAKQARKALSLGGA